MLLAGEMGMLREFMPLTMRAVAMQDKRVATEFEV